MKTLTIRLPDSLARRIEEESLTRGVSKSDIVRERLDQLSSRSSERSGLRGILEKAWTAKPVMRPGPRLSPYKQRIEEAIRGKKLHR